MPDPDAVERINREISAVADRMARLRDLIARMLAEGKSVEASEAALNALAELFRLRMRDRQLLQAAKQQDTDVDKASGEPPLRR